MSQAFDYVRAHSLDEAITLLNEPGLRSRVLAGGTDLLPQVRSGALAFDRVVDVTRVPELKVIAANGHVTVGAGVTMADIVQSALLQAKAPLLVQACRQMGSPQIRNVATLGGNVANAAACADSMPALVCLEAEAIVVTPQAEQRQPVTDLVTGPHKTQLPPGALIRAFTFEPVPPGSRTAYLRIVRRKALAIARLSLAALGGQDERGCISLIRLAPGAVFARFKRASPVEAMLMGQPPGGELFRAAGRRMAELFLAESGRRWSAEYKEQAIAALTERALRQIFGGQGEN